MKVSFQGVDKLVHLGIYMVLAFLWLVAVKNLKKNTFFKNNAYIVVFLACFLLGFSLEVIQGLFIKNRYFESADLIANGFGCIFGLITVRLIKGKTNVIWLNF